MRVSVDKDDPGHKTWVRNKRIGLGCKVFLDGVEQTKRAVTADDEEGIVIVLTTDERGRYVKNTDGSPIERATLRGVVRIEFEGAMRGQ